MSRTFAGFRFFFFFQAEDGIRDATVTGVQTCALPISGIKLAMVARGEADLYLNTYEAFHDWDIAAGHILVTEAGGTVTGLKGQTLRYGLAGAWQRDGLLASNGLVHDEAVRRLQSAD